MYTLGYIGIVKDATETTARVEIHSNCKTISVDRSRLNLIRCVVQLVEALDSWLRLRLHQSKYFWIRDESETFWSRIHFAVYTQNMNQTFPVSLWIRNLKWKHCIRIPTHESEFPCSVNTLRIRITWMLWIRKHSLMIPETFALV